MFASVFPRTAFTAPTPEVTPEIGTLSSPGRSFGGFAKSGGAIEESVKVSRAWSTAINWFKALLDGHGNHLDRQQQQAFEFLIARPHEDRLLRDWYSDAVAATFECTKQHYFVLTQPWIIDQISPGLNPSILSSIQLISTEIEKCLSIAHVTLEHDTQTYLHAWFRRLADKIGKKWVAMDLALPFRNKLEDAMADGFCTALAISSQRGVNPRCWCTAECKCSVDLDMIPLKQLRILSRGSHAVDTVLARALQNFLYGPALQKRCFRVDWQNRTSCVSRLQQWVRTQLAPVAEAALKEVSPDNLSFDALRIEDLTNSAVAGLARDRIDALFDFIKAWPHSEGAVEDIRAFLIDDNPAHKLYLCMLCEVQLQRRLLHVGASTSDILATYVNLIHVFEKLDARGVLLEKVSPSLRQYLRGRSDAINVIAASLLANTNVKNDHKDNPNICMPIAMELQNAVQSQTQRGLSLDWDDMQWMPEPIDASPNHRNSKSNDVLSHILGLYDQDDFVKEIETVLAQQLLKSQDPEVVRETRLLEVLKTRLNSTKLQNLEIMLKDMRDSITFEKRLRPEPDTDSVPTPKEVQAAIPPQGISTTELYSKFEKRLKRTHFQAILKLVAVRRSELLFPKRGRLPSEPEQRSEPTQTRDSSFQVRILSSTAWPQMQTSTFILPSALSGQLQEAEDRFGAMSGQRKLQWRPALGTMSVNLELEDRTIIEEDLPAWRGALINAFEDPNEHDDVSVTRTADQLADMLQMDEELVQEALSFWVSKRVLYLQSPGVFAVLERLDMDTMEVESTQALSNEAFSTLKSQDTVLRENAAMFEAFIGNMLRNGGPKEVGGMMGITNMMKMVVPTFTYGDEEVVWLLNQMLGRGEVSNDGDTWKITV